VGGGISGLSALHFIRKRAGPNAIITLVDKSQVCSYYTNNFDSMYNPL
jgi:protoporphyrinogen oxidase